MSTATNSARRPCVICVGGSATIDQIFLVDEVKLPSVKITATDFVETGGGMGANAAVAVQRLGGRAIYWGRVGDDETGDQVIALLKHEGIDVSTLLRLSGFRTKIATILIDARGERLVVSVQPQGYPPDASWLPIERVDDADAVLADTRWPAGAQRLFDAAAMAGKPSVFDGDAGDPQQVRDTARLATHPFLSQSMLQSLQTGEPKDALPQLFGGRNVVCGVTLGAAGVMWFDGKTSVQRAIAARQSGRHTRRRRHVARRICAGARRAQGTASGHRVCDCGGGIEVHALRRPCRHTEARPVRALVGQFRR